MSSQLDRIAQMLRALCGHLGLQEPNDQDKGMTESFLMESGRRYTGVVSRFEYGWGFIECDTLNRNFFVHHTDIDGAGLRSLDAGEVVSFELAPGKEGRPKAVRVRRGPAPPPSNKSPGFPDVPKRDDPKAVLQLEVEADS